MTAPMAPAVGARHGIKRRDRGPRWVDEESKRALAVPANPCGAPLPPSGDAPAAQQALVRRLACALAAGGTPVQYFETHISWVLVCGAHAYKLKKALRLPFLDYATLAARRRQCERECRLNRRLAPGLYLGVSAVAGDPARPRLDGAGAPIEYAVRMRAFAQSALWSYRIARGLLTGTEVDRLAALLARFHRDAARAPPDSPWGTPRQVADTFGATLDALAGAAPGDVGLGVLAGLRAWAARQGPALAALAADRKRGGMVRECHGDLHCGNILTRDGTVMAFDCIEFDDSLRWIDVMDDLAFVHMDLACRGRPDLAARLLNRYLEEGGDYAGLALLRHYRVHRALVRARVMLLRAGAPGTPAPERAACRRAGRAYLAFAHHASRYGAPAMVVMYGPAGSGKTTVARMLVELLGAVQLRSDVERKRLDRAAGVDLYGDDMTRRTYERLGELARAVTGAGWPVVIDAACLAAVQRARLRAVARDLGLPCVLVVAQAGRDLMRARVAARRRAGGDASDAGPEVLERQLQAAQPLSRGERRHAVVVDTGAAPGAQDLRAACLPVVAALRRVPVQYASRAFQAAHIDTAHIELVGRT